MVYLLYLVAELSTGRYILTACYNNSAAFCRYVRSSYLDHLELAVPPAAEEFRGYAICGPENGRRCADDERDGQRPLRRRFGVYVRLLLPPTA